MNQASNAESATVSVFLRPIGSPLAVGMSGLTVASLLQSGVDLAWIPKTQVLQVGLVLIAVPFVLQGLASVFSFLARDGAAGSATGVLATSWLALGLIYVVSGHARTNRTMGLMLVAVGGVLALSAFAVTVTKPVPGLVFLAAAARFVLAGVHELTGVNAWQHAGGIVGLVVCGGAAYCVLAFELEAQRHRPVLPTFRLGPGKASSSDDAHPQLNGVVHEAGVRQTT